MNELVFQEWQRLYKKVPKDSKFLQIAWDKMIELATTFEEWSFIYYNDRDDIIVKQAAMKRMNDIGTFQDWSLFYDKAPVGSKLKEASLKKMAELATTLDNYSNIYKKAPKGSNLSQIALEKMIDLATTFDDYWYVCDELPENSEMRQMVLKKLMELATTLDDYCNIYTQSTEKSETWQATLDKIAELTITINDCFNLYRTCDIYKRDYHSSPLVLIAQKKINELATTFEDWYIVYEKLQSDIAMEDDIAMEKMVELGNFQDWSNIYHKLNKEREEDIAEKRMYELAKTFMEWYKTAGIFPMWAAERALKKMTEIGGTLAEWCVVYNDGYKFGANNNPNFEKIAWKEMNRLIEQ